MQCGITQETIKGDASALSYDCLGNSVGIHREGSPRREPRGSRYELSLCFILLSDSLTHGDNDFPLGVTVSHITNSFRGLAKRVCPVDDRCDLS